MLFCADIACKPLHHARGCPVHNRVKTVDNLNPAVDNRDFVPTVPTAENGVGTRQPFVYAVSPLSPLSPLKKATPEVKGTPRGAKSGVHSAAALR